MIHIFNRQNISSFWYSRLSLLLIKINVCINNRMKMFLLYHVHIDNKNYFDGEKVWIKKIREFKVELLINDLLAERSMSLRELARLSGIEPSI